MHSGYKENFSNNNAELLKSSRAIKNQMELNARAKLLCEYVQRNYDIHIDLQSRHPADITVRAIIFKTLKSSKYTYSEIGRAFNRRHSTILRAIKKFIPQKKNQFTKNVMKELNHYNNQLTAKFTQQNIYAFKD